MRTVTEISAGGIVYRRRGGVTEVALIRVRRRWCLPKGQVGEGEGVEETAVREVREETGLDGRIVARLGDITYWYTNRTKEGETVRIFKRVYFYLLRWLRGDVHSHDQEAEEAYWFPIDQAVRRLFYPTERETMRKATSFLSARGIRRSVAGGRRASSR